MIGCDLGDGTVALIRAVTDHVLFEGTREYDVQKYDSTLIFILLIEDVDSVFISSEPV